MKHAIQIFSLLILFGSISAQAMNKQNNTTYSFHEAAKQGKIEWLEEFLEERLQEKLQTYYNQHDTTQKREFNINMQDKNGKTALLYACENNLPKTTRLLLLYGANTAIACDGVTPFHIACRYGYKKIAELLLEYSADALAETKKGWLPIHLAAFYGKTDILRLLKDHFQTLQYFRTNQKNPRSSACLHTATKGWTPLHFASLNGHVDTMQFLLKNGAPIDARTENHWTPLHCTIIHGAQEPLALLLHNNANINALTSYGWPPLLFAVYEGNEKLTSILLQQCALFVFNKRGWWSPIYLAAERGHWQFANKLVKMGLLIHNKQWLSHSSEDSLREHKKLRNNLKSSSKKKGEKSLNDSLNTKDRCIRLLNYVKSHHYAKSCEKREIGLLHDIQNNFEFSRTTLYHLIACDHPLVYALLELMSKNVQELKNIMLFSEISNFAKICRSTMIIKNASKYLNIR